MSFPQRRKRRIDRSKTNGPHRRSQFFLEQLEERTVLAANPGLASALQPNGKLLVGGSLNNGADTDFALVRYETNGNIDYSFGAGGSAITDFGASYDEIMSIAVQVDGK